jgi:hypothetical protein
MTHFSSPRWSTCIRFDHDFKFVLTQARWSKKLLRIDWQSDDRTAQTLEVPREVDGSASLKVGAGTLRFSQDLADKKATIISFISTEQLRRRLHQVPERRRTAYLAESRQLQP